MSCLDAFRLRHAAALSACFLAPAAGAARAAVTLPEGPLDVSECEIFADLVPRWEAALDQLGAPGCALAVVLDGEVYAFGSFGVRNPQGDPVDEDTMFYIASCTKTFTAGALARLAADGEVDLDATVRSYLPRFRLANEAAAGSITVRDLLCHRPGLNSSPIVFLDAYTGEITDDRYYHWLASVEPLGQVTYTNVHFTLAGRVLEAVAEASWKDALAEHLFEPAGMERTTAYASAMYADSNCAIPMQRAEAGGYEACPVRKGDGTMHAAGGTGTTARDGARWLQLQLRDGELEGKTVLAPRTVREMRERQSDREPEGRIRRLDGFGLGWMLGTYRGRPYVTHGGGYMGTAAHFSFLPDEGIGVVVLANASPAGQALVDVVSIDIYDRLLGEEGHEDLLEDYLNSLGDDGARHVPASELVAGGGLGLEPASYAGRYANEHWGTLSLRLVDGELEAAMGELGFGLAASRKDRFVARAVTGHAFDGSFVIEAGEVVAVELANDDHTMTFARTD